MAKILVAIPGYNCEKQIGRVLAGFDKKLLDRVEKVIVIDNQSKDDMIGAAKAAIAKLGTNKIEVWRNDGNYNLGGSHKVAFLAGEKLGMDYVAILHGDAQAKTEELSKLIHTAAANPEAAAILGCRFMSGSKLVGYDWKRIWGNRVLNWIYSIVALRPSKDLGSGLNLFRLKDLSDHRYLGYGDTMTFNIDLLLGYFSKGSKLLYEPITWSEEDQVSNARNFKIAETAIKKLMGWRFGTLKYTGRQPGDYTSSHV